jgi:hypothetical protein
MFRFNSGCGGVTCDVCQVLFDEYLSPAEYEEWFGDEPDYCPKHTPKKVLTEKDDSQDIIPSVV